MLGQFVCKTMYDVYLETLVQNTKPPICLIFITKC